MDHKTTCGGEETVRRWDAAARFWAETVRKGGDINREAMTGPAMRIPNFMVVEARKPP